YDVLLHSLVIGDIDMLVGALRDDKTRRGITQEALFVDGLSIVARADHPLFKLHMGRPEDLSDCPWALPRRNTLARALFDTVSAQHGFGPPPGEGIIETGSLVALRGILERTDRLTILSRHQIKYEEEAGLLSVVPVEL